MPLAILILILLAVIIVSAFAVAREIARDGHGRRPSLSDYNSRQPAP